MKYRISKKRKGAATVELTLALFILFAITLVYWEFVAVFFVQQRVNYATYMSERANTVEGNAANVAAKLNSGGDVQVSSGVRLISRLELPVNLSAPWSGRGVDYFVQKDVDMPKEPIESGDN